jgi:hypothetical protein
LARSSHAAALHSAAANNFFFDLPYLDVDLMLLVAVSRYFRLGRAFCQFN